jgi:hypothetical protein
MWSFTSDDAIEMYKRFLLARYRNGALEVATEQAALLFKKGDLSRCQIWNDVAEKIKFGSRQSPGLRSGN